METTVGKVLSVNIGTVREFEYSGRPAKSAIWKTPAVGRIPARGVNFDGDEQADRKVHGGADKAVYAYAVEDVRWWEQEIGRSLAYSEFGENLTTEGIEVNNALVGERWEIGTTILEVSESRIPCWRLGVRMNDKMVPRRFTEALRPGSYLRIVVEGDVGAGDDIRVVARPVHDLTVRDVFRIYTRDRHQAERLLMVPQVSESWKSWADHLLQKAKRRPADASEPGCCEDGSSG
ncbi:MAG: MOSC domain-containing protein [Candidatus Binatia bacterium]